MVDVDITCRRRKNLMSHYRVMLYRGGTDGYPPLAVMCVYDGHALHEASRVRDLAILVLRRDFDTCDPYPDLVVATVAVDPMGVECLLDTYIWKSIAVPLSPDCWHVGPLVDVYVETTTWHSHRNRATRCDESRSTTMTTPFDQLNSDIGVLENAVSDYRAAQLQASTDAATALASATVAAQKLSALAAIFAAARGDINALDPNAPSPAPVAPAPGPAATPAS